MSDAGPLGTRSQWQPPDSLLATFSSAVWAFTHQLDGETALLPGWRGWGAFQKYLDLVMELVAMWHMINLEGYTERSRLVSEVNGKIGLRPERPHAG